MEWTGKWAACGRQQVDGVPKEETSSFLGLASLLFHPTLIKAVVVDQDALPLRQDSEWRTCMRVVAVEAGVGGTVTVIIPVVATNEADVAMDDVEAGEEVAVGNNSYVTLILLYLTNHRCIELKKSILIAQRNQCRK